MYCLKLVVIIGLIGNLITVQAQDSVDYSKIVEEKIDIIVGKVNKYVQTNVQLEDLISTDSDQTMGAYIYGKIGKTILNNFNTISQLVSYVKHEIGSTLTVDDVIKATEGYLNVISGSSKDLQSLSKLVENGGWTAELSDDINSVFGALPGLTSKTISHFIADCQFSGSDQAIKKLLADDLTQLSNKVEKLSYIFENLGKLVNIYEFGFAFYNSGIKKMHEIIDTMKNSYNFTIQTNIKSIQQDETDFQTTLNILLSMRPGKTSHGKIPTDRDARDDRDDKDEEQGTTLNPSHKYLNLISEKFFFEIADNMKHRLTQYANENFKVSDLAPIRKNIRISIFNALKNKQIAKSISCISAGSAMPLAIETLLRPRFDALFTELIPLYFPVVTTYADGLPTQFKNKLKELYSIMKPENTSQSDTLNALKNAIKKIKPGPHDLKAEQSLQKSTFNMIKNDIMQTETFYGQLSSAFDSVIAKCIQ